MDKMENICWLIDRYDSLRSSTASRAAIIVSANALLLASTTFMLGQLPTDIGSSGSQWQPVAMLIAAAVTIVFLIISMMYASSAIAFVWNTTRQAIGHEELSSALYFNPRETVSSFSNPDQLRSEYREASEEQLMNYAIGELFMIANAQHKRYRPFRRSLKFLTLAIVAFSITVLLYFSGYVL